MNVTFKGVIICLLFLLPFSANARYGWRVFNIYSLYGVYLHPPSGWIQTIEVGYDHSRKSCLARPSFAGIGLVAGFGKDFKEIGVKAFYNPTRYSIGISRSARLNPYAFVQANWRLQSPKKSDSKGSLRAGVGLAGIFLSSSLITIRPKIQIGFSPTDYQEPMLHGLVAEFKVGFAINTVRVKNLIKERRKNQDSS